MRVLIGTELPFTIIMRNSRVHALPQNKSGEQPERLLSTFGTYLNMFAFTGDLSFWDTAASSLSRQGLKQRLTGMEDLHTLVGWKN